jgi:pterin-4a-carbinolamine dehydratase
MLFINYRREDSIFAARAIAESLRHRFGAENIFVDETSILDASEWPLSIESSIENATAVLCLVGSNWLHCSDALGRRRIDDPNDWVRKELILSRTLGKPIFVRTVANAQALSAKDALPDELRWLPEIQSKPISDQHWYYDIDALMREMIQSLGFADISPSLPLPLPNPSERKRQAHNRAQIKALLKEVPGWDVVESIYPPREELRRIFSFTNFKHAVDFMSAVAENVNKHYHHPRWENLLRTVTIYFSTWDVGCKVTKHDIEAAKLMDKWYHEYCNGERWPRASSGTGISEP